MAGRSLTLDEPLMFVQRFQRIDVFTAKRVDSYKGITCLKALR